MRRIGMMVAGFLACVPTSAWPCSGPVCGDMFRPVPGYYIFIPANAPAVGVQTAIFSERNWDGGSVSLSSSLTSAALHFPDGGVITSPTSVRPEAVLFAAPPGGFVETFRGWDGGGMESDAGIDGGAVNLALRLTWEASSGACVGEQFFGIGPAAPVPTTAATLSFSGFRMAQGTPNLCGGPLGTVQYASLWFQADAEMEPWLPLARWELLIDGQNWSATNFGSRGIYRPPEGMHSILEFHVQCVDGGGGDDRLAPGTHTAQLVAHILGMNAPIPSNTLSLTFDCATGTAGDGGVQPGADGGIDAGAAGGLDAGTDAGTDAGPPAGNDAGVDDVRKEPPALGCQTASLAWVSLAGLLLRRRRGARA